MNDPSEEAAMKAALDKTVPLATIFIRIGPEGPIVMGGLVESVLNDREILSEEGAALLKEAFHRSVEAILNTIANAPGSQPPVALSDKHHVLDRIDREEADKFWKENVIIDE